MKNHIKHLMLIIFSLIYVALVEEGLQASSYNIIQKEDN